MGRITLKQAYEIAKYHATSEWNIARDLSERDIIPMIIDEARKLGVEVKENLKMAKVLTLQRLSKTIWRLPIMLRSESMPSF